MSSDQPFLDALIARHGGVAGTVHRCEGGLLVLSAALKIPPSVREATREIPMGKGMAGLAWQRRQPVQTCNLQDDSSGDVRPGAKAVNAGAAIALPIFDEVGEIYAVVGVAFPGEGRLPKAKVDALSDDAHDLAPR